MAQLKGLMIHCSATPEGKYFDERDIRHWHTSPKSEGGRGWRQVGYSDIVLLDGTLVNLVDYNEDDFVDPWELTNGAAGYNSYFRHVCYIGGMTKDMKRAKDTRTEEQYYTLQLYVEEFLEEHPDAVIIGHCQVASKACPSFSVPDFLREIGIPERNIHEGKYRL